MSSFFKSNGSVDTETLPQSGSNVASNTENNSAVSSFFKTSGANSTDEATIQSSVDAAAASATAAANSATSASDSATAAANSAAVSSTFTTGGGSVGGDVSITGSLSITGSVDGRDVATDGTKLDGIEAGATADQTDAEIKTAYENNSDTNAFTDALQTKLAGIETGATADQTAAEIRTLVDSATDSNVFTDADHTKLDGIETGADVTDTTNVVAALTAGTNVTIAADGTISSTDTDTTYSNATTSVAGLMSASDKTKLDGVETGATADQTASEIKSAYESNTDTNAFTDADHTKLDGIETGATADQTAAEIKTAYESNSDTNAFTDADHTKLDGIEDNATADQTANEILTAVKTVDGASSGLDADLLDGQEGSYYTSYADTAVSNLVDSAPSTLNTLNELAAALGDDANFSTTVTNSIATKLPLAGGTMTGNITFSGSQTFDGRDLSTDGAKLDGIESGATADQTKADIDALNIDAATLDGIDSASFLRSDQADSFSGTLTGTGAVTTSSYLESGRGSGGVSLTVNDGYGNANIAFNHRNGTPEQTGQAGRIQVNTDNTGTNNAQMQFQLGAATASTAASLTEIMRLKETAVVLKKNTEVTGNITVSGTVDGRDVAADGTKLDGIEASADVTDATNVAAAGAAIFSTTPTANITDGTNGQVLTTDGSGGLSFTTVAATGSFLPLSGGTLTGALTSRVANDVVLTVHSDTNTTPTAALALMRGTNDTYGADAYTDWKLENGYGSGGSAGGTLSVLRTVDGAADTYYMDFYKDASPARHHIDMLQDVDFQKAIREKAYNCTGSALDPSNGTLQYKTLTANTTFTESFSDGESITLMIDDGSSYTVTWPAMTWASGSAPTLATSGYTTVVLWHRGGLYGAVVS